MHKKFHVDYDTENDSLFLYREKSHGGVEVGNLLLDFNNRKELVSLEILDATKFLQSMNTSTLRVTKKLLASITECRLDTKEESGLLLIKVFLFFQDETRLVTPITVWSIKESSPLVVEM